LSVLHPIEFLGLWRNIKEADGSVNAKQDSKLNASSSIGGFSQGLGDFFRDCLNFDFFHALIVAVRALLFVTRGTAQI
jgi:hypothetical protein